MDYTAPYVIIEGAYLVRNESPLRANDEVDRPGTRIAVGRGSAYDLYLTRALKSATLVHAPTSPAVVAALRARLDGASELLREHVEWALGRHGALG